MCLILFSWDNHPKYKLIVAANRDEFYERPTTSLGIWEDDENIIAGKDLTAGGTWMGINKSGRFSALTNYRDIANIKQNAPSRGDLTRKYLSEEISDQNFFDFFKPTLSDFNGFNILNGNFDQLTYFNNEHQQLIEIKPGIYGLSNAFLDTNWPKVSRAKEMFSSIVKAEEPQTNDLINFLQDKTQAEDKDLPETGLSYEMEKVVSSMFIESANYGTCCSTVLTVDYSGKGRITERSYPVGNRSDEIKSFEFDWKAEA